MDAAAAGLVGTGRPIAAVVFNEASAGEVGGGGDGAGDLGVGSLAAGAIVGSAAPTNDSGETGLAADEDPEPPPEHPARSAAIASQAVVFA